jgi:hypothetical protein
MARPREHDFPAYMTVDGDRGGFLVRNPLTGNKKRFADEQTARTVALRLAEFVQKERQAQLVDVGRPTINGLVEKWRTDQLPFMPWKAGTKTNYHAKLNRIQKEMGHRLVARTDSIFLTDWLSSFCHTADTYNKWRFALVLLFRFAVSRKYVAVNEAEAVIERSNSLVIEANQKVRRPLDLSGYKAIYQHAPEWLQVAMDLALVTLQGRSEICNMRHSDFREGFLFVIREKTSNAADAAFIKIRVTDDIKALRQRALHLDNILSPFVVHRKPERRLREVEDAKEHWTYIRPDYLTKAFAKARSAAGVYNHYRDEEQPTFHEIRGLGSRRCKERGMENAAIKILMAHAEEKTTLIYLKGGEKALRDSDYVTVEAPLTLQEMLG